MSVMYLKIDIFKYKIPKRIDYLEIKKLGLMTLYIGHLLT